MIFFPSCFCSPHLVYQQNLGTQPFSNPEVLLAFFPRLLSQRTGARPSEDTFVLHLEQCKWFFAAVWCAFLFLGASSWVIWEKTSPQAMVDDTPFHPLVNHFPHEHGQNREVTWQHPPFLSHPCYEFSKSHDIPVMFPYFLVNFPP